MSDKNKIEIPDEEYWYLVGDHVGFGKIYILNSKELILDLKKFQLPKDKLDGKSKDISAQKDNRGWLMCGGVGTGKTTMLCYMVYQILRQREFTLMKNESTDWGWRIDSIPRIYYVRTGELFNLFFEKKLERIDELKNCWILFLDDLGVEYSSEYPLSKFEDFIEYRYSELLTTFITTNLSPERLKEDLDWARIVDRLLDPKWMQLVTIAGESLRGKEMK